MDESKILTMEYYSTVKGIKCDLDDITWMNLESTLSERVQS